MLPFYKPLSDWKERACVNQNGKLAQTSHPKAFGSRNFHPTIQTDFSEQQLELITPIVLPQKKQGVFLLQLLMWLDEPFLKTK